MLEGSILRQLKEKHGHGHAGGNPLNLGVYYKNTLVALCHALEDSILESSCRPLMITAFQQGKWYLQEAERYGEIANRAEQIAILAAPDGKFGDHPTSRLSNVALVSLDPSDPVAQEWHLIIVSSTYTAMVLCQELSDEDYGSRGRPEIDLERKFYGFWTFEPQLVIETAQLAIAKITEYNPLLATQLNNQLSSIQSGLDVETPEPGLPSVERVDLIVTKVVDYLHNSPSVDGESSVSSPILTFGESHHLDKNLVSNKLQAFLRVAELMDRADVQNSNAGAEVAALAEAIGQLLDLPGWQLHRLRLAGLLHRLALLQATESVLAQHQTSDESNHTETAPYCPLVPGTQVLRTMPRLRAIATIITHQTEWWNGEGSPARLSGDSIPLESRILGLTTEFQRQLSQLYPLAPSQQRFNSHFDPKTMQEALAICSSQSGEKWDPKLVEVLTILVNGFSQGMSLHVSVPKIASGLWLLDSFDAQHLVGSTL